MGCDTSLTLGCRLSASLCQCTFNLIIPEQMNATRQEMRYPKQGVPSVCDMQRFPATMYYQFVEGKMLTDVLNEQRSIVGIEKRSWPLFEWHSRPKEAVIQGDPFLCPEPPVKEAEKEIRPGRKRPDRPSRKDYGDVCLCPDFQDNGKGQCSHKELICETISLTQAIDNLRRGGGGLFDVYVEKFPQLKDYVEPISGTAIATDQVSQENWATLLAAVDSVIERGLDSDLNLPAEANDEF
ncbi:hypothetical protein BCR37DRAFT_380636 [Protomyces lactucae-debilis]|uniref:Uncharacterized protein n=1 Tax=Protomyces lactucae-debilis TaxID=2754530 RepID=A0A1Y2FDB1_PROLT|nr:uncharacterized protein BCR37DRAFT_380636 [Protomyces lactucae-debilis]ORY80835.1 hypothetical protein BCR37DRAFT_380636 [Protomyces lactucae-debilis]